MTPFHQDEFTKISSIKKVLPPASSRVHVGIGDDAALVEPPRHALALCSDALVEGVHFDLSFVSARDLGHKALTACLSDIAAMNARPLYALLSIALPKETPEEFLEEFYQGAGLLTKSLGVDIVGGDLTSSPNGIFIDVVCVGECEKKILRSGAKPGDLVAVSGTPGASAAGLAALLGQKKGALQNASLFPELISAHLRPRPRFDLLSALNSTPHLCTAMIDISDGISSELHHIARASGVGFEVWAANIPLHPQAVQLAEQTGESALDWALSGGEDYELLVTLDSDLLNKMNGSIEGFTIIGRALPKDQGLQIVNSDGLRHPLPASGFNHFR